MNLDDEEFFFLTVPGTPQPAGSKRAFVVQKRGGKPRAIVTDDNRKSGAWKDKVALFARDAMKGVSPDAGPLSLDVTFTLPRPTSHYRSGKNAALLKAGAPLYPTTRPDSTKLLRAVEDALLGIVYEDDSQVVETRVVKQYGSPPGMVEIHVARIKPAVHEPQTFVAPVLGSPLGGHVLGY